MEVGHTQERQNCQPQAIQLLCREKGCCSEGVFRIFAAVCLLQVPGLALWGRARRIGKQVQFLRGLRRRDGGRIPKPQGSHCPP